MAGVLALLVAHAADPRANLYWMKAQEFPETLCIPSEAIQYRDTLAKPSGVDIVP